MAAKIKFNDWQRLLVNNQKVNSDFAEIFSGERPFGALKRGVGNFSLPKAVFRHVFFCFHRYTN